MEDQISIYEVEYGSNMRFLDPEFAEMIDSDGKVMFCKCGNKATGGAFGKDSFVIWCPDCSLTGY